MESWADGGSRAGRARQRPPCRSLLSTPSDPQRDSGNPVPWELPSGTSHSLLCLSDKCLPSPSQGGQLGTPPGSPSNGHTQGAGWAFRLQSPWKGVVLWFCGQVRTSPFNTLFPGGSQFTSSAYPLWWEMVPATPAFTCSRCSQAGQEAVATAQRGSEQVCTGPCLGSSTVAASGREGGCSGGGGALPGIL